MFRKRVSLLLLTFAAVPASAVYESMPFDALDSFDSARPFIPHAIRVDGHFVYTHSGGFWGPAGHFNETEPLGVFYFPIRLGWTFDRVWEADMVLPFARYSDRRAGDSGITMGDLWLSVRSVWPYNRDGSFRLGGRLAYSLVPDGDSPISAGAPALDLSAVGYYKRPGARFRCDGSFGFRYTWKGTRYPDSAGFSTHIDLTPGLAVGRKYEWTVGMNIGGFYNVTGLGGYELYMGPEIEYTIGEDVFLEAGVKYPVSGSGGTLGAYREMTERNLTVYVGTQAFIPMD
jgi:hypothetical protein